MADFINTIDALGDDAVVDSIIDRSITEFADDTISILNAGVFMKCTALTHVNLPALTRTIGWPTPPAGPFSYCSALKSVEAPLLKELGVRCFESCSSIEHISFPNVTTIEGSYVFTNCASMKSIDLPLATKIPDLSGCKSLESVNLPLATTARGVLNGCTALKKITLPKLNSITGNGMYESLFRGCTALKVIDVPSVTSIGTYGLYNCSALTALILRNTETVCTLGSATTSFNSTAVASGELYIYVPASLIESYKAATNWSSFADQFRALEDYTVDGTITGELDETKIAA